VCAGRGEFKHWPSSVGAEGGAARRGALSSHVGVSARAVVGDEGIGHLLWGRGGICVTCPAHDNI
jgi:hypothetical protein